MTGWLLDTNVISRFAPGQHHHKDIITDVSAWMTRNSDSLFLSAISVTEITAGIGKLRRNTSMSRADEIEGWLDTLLKHYSERVLPVDIDVARLAGLLSEKARATGHAPGLADLLIASTAQARALGLLTENIRHFAPLATGFGVLNPFEHLPP